MRIVYFDTETTGTDPNVHAIIQIAGMVVDYDNDFSVIEEVSFDIKCRPFTGAKIDQKALEVNGVNIDDIMNDPDRLNYSSAYNEFIKQSKLGKPKSILCGYNVGFDISMVQAMAEKCGDRYFFTQYFWPAIDVAQVAATHCIKHRGEFKKFNLTTVAEYYGWQDTTGAHEALFDVKMTRFIYEKILCEMTQRKMISGASDD